MLFGAYEIHASQYLYYPKFNFPLFEVEDRIIALYSYYLLADPTIRHKEYAFSLYMQNTIGEWVTQYPFLSAQIVGVTNFYPGQGKSGFDLITSYFDLKINNKLNNSNIKNDEESKEIVAIKDQLKTMLNSYAGYLKKLSSSYSFTQKDVDDWGQALKFFENEIK